MTADADPAQLRDIKGFVAIQVPDWVWLSLALLLLGGIIYFAYQYYSSRPKPVLSIYELTIQELEKLNSQLMSKDFYLLYSEIVRPYLESRLNLELIDKTVAETRELFLASPVLTKAESLSLLEILGRGDLAKFAKQVIDVKIQEEDRKESIIFIQTLEAKLEAMKKELETDES